MNDPQNELPKKNLLNAQISFGAIVESIKRFLKMISQKNEQKKLKSSQGRQTFLILGVPKSGKTTFFCTMAHHLQKVSNASKNLNFKVVDNHTLRFIDTCMDHLNHQEWPDKTQKKAELNYRFQFSYKKKFLGIPLYVGTTDIVYHDYPGEAFTGAFSENTENGMFAEDAEQLRKGIETANGIFIILDAKEMYNTSRMREMNESMSCCFKTIQENNKRSAKIALIFNKAELIPDFNQDDYEQRFKMNYGNAYAWLPENHQFFTIYPIGECTFNEKGELVPVVPLKPKNLLRPLYWMINFL